MPKKALAIGEKRDFYSRVKKSSAFSQGQLRSWLQAVSKTRIEGIANDLSKYISKNIPAAISVRSGLPSYRTNPYVSMTSASMLDLRDMNRFASFLFNSKVYAGLETSFGKSLESELLKFYPSPERSWQDPPEKTAEFKKLIGLTNEEKARRRDKSVWREIDKSYSSNGKRFLLTVKSGPNCINDTQVEAMKDAIVKHHRKWLAQSMVTYPGTKSLDVVIGLTYGTERTTNNKENQILVKLMEHGFYEDPKSNGVLVSKKIPGVRVYRAVGRGFWAVVGNPVKPQKAEFVFVEVLLGLLHALKQGATAKSLEELVNAKIQELANAIRNLAVPLDALPEWMRGGVSPEELSWLMASLSVFFDEGL